MDIMKKITKARIQLLLHQPFYGVLTMNLIPRIDNREPTAATDGKYIYFNERWVSKLSIEELQFVFGHEVLHCALNHFARESGRNHQKWNRATDYAVNSLLIKGNVGKPPNGILYNREFEGLNAEKIYNILPDSDEQTLDRHIDSSEWSKDLTNEWRKALARAAQTARQYGNLPAEIERIVKDILEPKVDWREELRRFIDNTVISDYTWIPPNRRYVWSGTILPGVTREGITAVIAIDTSGSIGKRELASFFAETISILETYNTEAYVIGCDAEVHTVNHFPMGTKISPGDIRVKGGGGTSFVPPFRWVEENNVNPNVFIYLTDGFGMFPVEQPPYPVIWVVTSDTEVPFGHKIKLEV